MVDTLLAFDRISIEDDDITKFHVFRNSAGGTLGVTTVLSAAVFEKRTFIGNSGKTSREYILAIEYTAGAAELNLRMEKTEINNSFINPSSVFIRAISEPGATTDIDFNSLPYEIINDRVLYNLFIWGIGVPGGATRDLYCRRVPKDKDFESGITATTGVTSLDYSGTSRPIQSPQEDFLDYFTLVT